MKDIFYSGLKIVIIFLIMVVIVNDAGAILMTQIGAGDLAQAVADAAVSSYKTSHSPAEAQRTAESVAQQRGIKITAFYMDNKAITVNAEVPPRRTFLAHRIESLESYLSSSVTVTADIESPVD